MGKGKITSDSLIEANALQTIINDAAALEAQLQAILKVNQEILKNNPFKTSQDVKDFQASIDSSKSAIASLAVVEKEQLKLKEQLLAAEDDAVKGRLRMQAANADQRKALKLEIELEKDNLGTLEKLEIINKKLTAERKKLDLATIEGTKRLKEINDELDKNNEKIKENSDKLTQQRLNIGNYTKSVIDALDKSGHFSAVTDQLSAAQSTLTSISKTLIATQEAYRNGTLKASVVKTFATIKTNVLTVATIAAAAAQTAWTIAVKAFSRSIYGIPVFGWLLAIIGAIIGAVALLITHWEKITSLFKSGETEAEKAAKALEKYNKAVIAMNQAHRDGENALEYRLKLLKAQGTTANEIRKAEMALMNARVKNYREKLLLDLAEFKRLEMSGTLTKEEIEEKRKAFDDEIFAYRKLTQERKVLMAQQTTDVINEIKKQTQAEIDAIKKRQEEADRARKEKAEKDAKENERLLKEAKELEAARTKKFLAEAEEYAKRKKAIDDGIIANMKKQAEEREKIFKQENRENEERLENLAKLRAAYVETAQKGTEVLMSSVAQQQKISMQNTDRQIALTQERIGREQQLANLGFENRLADEEANAAKLEAERQRKERQQFRAQRALAYIETFRGFLSSGDNPGAATGKTAVIMAAIEASLAGFYEGTENVAEALGAPHLGAKKDGYIIRVDGAERIFKPSHNQVLTPYTNDEVVDIVQAHKRGGANYVSTMSDTRIVNELQEVKKAVSNIELHIDWDAYDNRVERKIRNGSKHVITYVKGGRL